MLAAHLAQLRRRDQVQHFARPPFFQQMDSDDLGTFVRALVAGIRTPGAYPGLDLKESALGQPQLSNALHRLHTGQTHPLEALTGVLLGAVNARIPSVMVQQLGEALFKGEQHEGLPTDDPRRQAFHPSGDIADTADEHAFGVLHALTQQLGWRRGKNAAELLHSLLSQTRQPRPAALGTPAALPRLFTGHLAALVALHHALSNRDHRHILEDAIGQNVQVRQHLGDVTHTAQQPFDFRPNDTVPEDYFALSRRR